MNQYSIEVENIKCSGCANSIRKAVSTFEGVESVEVNIENEIITVTGNADIDTIKNKLKQMGYPEKGKNSLKSKAVSYISCAIGRLDN